MKENPDVIARSMVIEPGFNVRVTHVLGIQLDPAAMKALGSKWTAGKAIPGLLSSPETLARLGLASTKAGDKVKVTYLGNDATKEKFQVEDPVSGRTEVIGVAAEALRKK